MNKIVFTGTSPGFPAKDRACSSFVLMVGDKVYQFDAGEGFSAAVQRLKINYDDIECVFISHLHPDHITGIFLELQLMQLAKRTKSLDIYVPEEGVSGLENAASTFYLFKEKLPFTYRFIPICPNPAFRDGDMALYAYPNQHLSPNKEVIEKLGASNRMQSYSYVIVVNGKRILYSGDIKDEADIKDLLDGVHTAIIEGMHGDFVSLTQKCAEARVNRLVVTHLPANVYARPAKLLSIARKAGLKKLIIATDGLKLTF